MSSTKRGSVIQPGELYETPVWCTEALIKDRMHRFGGECGVAIDPCCGRGSILRVVNRLYPAYHTIGIEKYCDDGENWISADALAIDWPFHNVCIMNPPFSWAIDFCEKALKYRSMGDTVAVLMRLGMMASKKRSEFWDKHPNCDVYVLPRRPSFVGGTTDSCDYAWFVWGGTSTSRWCRL